MPDNADTIVGVVRDEATAHEWALVLLSRGLSPCVQRTPAGIELTVPHDEEAQALAELAAYTAENPPVAPPPAFTVAPGQMLAGTLVGLALRDEGAEEDQASLIGKQPQHRGSLAGMPLHPGQVALAGDKSRFFQVAHGRGVA